MKTSQTFGICATSQSVEVEFEFNPDDHARSLNARGWFKRFDTEDGYDAVRVGDRVSTRYGDVDFSALGHRAHDAAEAFLLALAGGSR